MLKIKTILKYARWILTFGIFPPNKDKEPTENPYLAIDFHKTLNTLPIANFDAILKTGNLNYLYKVDFFEVDLSRQVPPGFYSILTDLMKEIPEVDNTTLRMEYEKEVSEFNYMITGDYKQLNKFRLLQSRLEDLKLNSENEKRSGSLMEESAILEKDLGLKMQIDIYTIPSLKYMAYKKIRKEQIKQMNNV
jgi:hypothetical protein